MLLVVVRLSRHTDDQDGGGAQNSGGELDINQNDVRFTAANSSDTECDVWQLCMLLLTA